MQEREPKHCVAVGPPASGGVSCDTSDAFASRVAEVTAECCDEPAEICTDGYPATCNAGCAAVLLPMRDSCEAGFLSTGPFRAVADVLNQAVSTCSPPPPPCETFGDLQTLSLAAEAACCPNAACPDDDLPTVCAPGVCADTLTTMQDACHEFLIGQGGLLRPVKNALDAVVASCSASGGH